MPLPNSLVSLATVEDAGDGRGPLDSARAGFSCPARHLMMVPPRPPLEREVSIIHHRILPGRDSRSARTRICVAGYLI